MLGAAAFAIALLAALVLVPSPVDEDEREALRAASIADPHARPDWRVGDAWRVQFDAGDPVCWLVVAQADELGYRQGVWCPTDEAPLIAAQLATMRLPYAGAFTLDLGGVAGEEVVTWFEWPLADGKTWPTTWGGAPAHVEASWLDAQERYELDLCLDDGLCVASYDYDPELGWWSELVLRGGFELRVHEREEGWTRGHVLADAVERRSSNYNGVSVDLLATARPAFDVDEGEDVVVVEIQREGVHSHDYSLVGPEGRFATSYSSSSLVYADDYVWDMVDAEPGRWTISENFVAEGMIHNHVWTVTYTGE